MVRKTLSALSLALLFALTPATARAQEDFGGGGGVDYSGGYDGGGYDTGSYGYDTGSYDAGTSSDQWGGSSDVMSGSQDNGAALSGSSGVDTNDVAGGQPAAWDQPALTNDPWTTGTTADPYASSTDPWATTPSNDPWSSSTAPSDPSASSNNESWTSNASSDPYTSASDPWANTTTSNDPWTTGTTADPYASSTDPWATTPSNDPWSTSAPSNETSTSASDGWTSSATAPEGWSSSAPDGWSSASSPRSEVDAAPMLGAREGPQATEAMRSDYVPSEQADRVVQLAGSATPAERELLQQRFDAMPEGARNTLEASGTRIVTCRDDVTDALPGLAGTTEDGRRMNQLGGAFAPAGSGNGSVTQPTVAVCTSIGPDGAPRFSSLQGSRDLFGHEVGHGLDSALGYPSQSDPAFREAMSLDRTIARSGDPAAQGTLGGYFNGLSANGSNRGASESYAEGYANYLNRDTRWGGTYEYFRSQPQFRR